MLNLKVIINTILELFDIGSKSELILNVLLFADFSRWKQKQLKMLMEMIEEILSSGHEQNRILLCYNPVLAICLSCEFVNKIATCKLTL